MKVLLIKIIGAYQLMISVFLKHLLGTTNFCKYRPTCSDYAREQIREKGVFKGTTAFVKRVATCHNISI